MRKRNISNIEKVKILNDFDNSKDKNQFIINLYSKGYSYKQFSQIFNIKIQEVIQFFRDENIKYCPKCKKLLSWDQFSKASSNFDGLHYKCKKCDRQAVKLNTIKNIEKRRKYNKEYHKKNSEKGYEYRVRYRQSCAKYDTFSSRLEPIEKTRKDPNNLELLQVRCKLCNEWFNPSNSQCQNRISSILGNQIGENNFYCCQECKDNCDIRYAKKIPKSKRKRRINRDTNFISQLKKIKIEKNIDVNGKLICEKCQRDIDQNEVILHHIQPVVIDEIISYDVDNVILLCNNCHKEVHEIPGCTISDLVRVGLSKQNCKDEDIV